MPKCDFKNIDTCNKKQALIIGYCKFCKKNFCAEHRLPESHQCEFYSDCKNSSYIKNKEKLLDEASNKNKTKIESF